MMGIVKLSTNLSQCQDDDGLANISGRLHVTATQIMQEEPQ